MKKLLLTIFVGCITIGSTMTYSADTQALTEEEAYEQLVKNYKEYDLSANFANKLKQGTLPRAKGKIGTPKKNLKLKYKYNSWIDKSVETNTNYWDEYEFVNSKVSLIEREYTYVISKSSLKKRLGTKRKVYDRDGTKYYFGGQFYKKGRYYIYVRSNTSYMNQYTTVAVGTKKAIMKRYGVIIK